MHESLNGKVILITGAARRLGAASARLLHAAGANIVLHYRGSSDEAQALQQELEAQRKNSVVLAQADLLDLKAINALVQQAQAAWGHLDGLLNNASLFYPGAIGEVTEEAWDQLLGANLKAPFFLAQAAAPHLKKTGGAIVNIADIHGERPLKGYPVYSISKAGVVMLTRTLAAELGPEVRVNAIAPGAVLWPESGLSADDQDRILSRTFLKRQGCPDDIARAALFLLRDARYTTGQTIAVDGGRSLNS